MSDREVEEFVENLANIGNAVHKILPPGSNYVLLLWPDNLPEGIAPLAVANGADSMQRIRDFLDRVEKRAVHIIEHDDKKKN